MDKKALIFSIITIALGGTSVVTAWWGYASIAGIILGAAAIVFYTITSKMQLTNGQQTMIKVGLILGIVGVVAGIIMLIVTIACSCAARQSLSEWEKLAKDMEGLADSMN